MTLLKLLAVFVSTGLLAGCVDDIKADVRAAKEDVKAVKMDIRALKSYMAALPTPNACLGPGEPQARICYYELAIKVLDKKRGLFKGHVTSKLVQEGADSCQKIKDAAKDLPEWQDYKCADPKHYAYLEYGFKIADAPPDLKDGEYSFYNLPNTEYLKLGKPEAETLTY